MLHNKPMSEKSTLSAPTDLDLLHQEYQKHKDKLQNLVGLGSTIQGRDPCQIGITEGQLQLISNLFPIKTEQHLVEGVLGRTMDNYRQLSQIDVRTLISNYRKHHSLNSVTGQVVKNLILPNLTWGDISKSLGRTVISLGQLRNSDLKRLLQSHPKIHLGYSLENFRLRPLDQPLISNSDWEYGIQTRQISKRNVTGTTSEPSSVSTNSSVITWKMQYLKFYQWLMMDFDDITLSELCERLQPILESDPSLLFYLYRTRNGFHLHLMSSPRNHYQTETAKWMVNLGCDVWYILFSYRNGYRIRMSHKPGEDSDEPIYQWVQSLGRGKVHPDCQLNYQVYLSYLEH